MAGGKIAAKVGRAACPHAAEGGVLATKNTKATKAMKPSGVAWLGDIPDGWELRRGKYLLSQISEPSSSQNKVALENIESGTGKYIDSNAILQGNGIAFTQGDILYGKLRPYLAKVWLAEFEGNAVGDFFVYRVATAYYNCYAKYVMLAPSFTAITNDSTYGAKMPRVSAEFIANLRFPLPPLPEQRAIADYLDKKCGAIDAAIAEAKKGIEEYKAWKISLIDDVVCNGIVRHKCRKETGEVWLTDIPDEWEFTQIRYLFALRDERNDKPLKDVNLISLYTDKGVVQHADLEKTTGNKASTADGYKLVYENDIVANIILCWMGAVGRSAYNGVTSPAYDVYRPINPTKVLSRYYHYLFRTPRFNGNCYEEGRGIMMMRWRTYSSEFRAIKVPVPPIEEQQAIANYLDEKCAAIDAMVTEKEALISDLESYKKSLIYEVVTGKKEPEAAASGTRQEVA